MFEFNVLKKKFPTLICTQSLITLIYYNSFLLANFWGVHSATLLLAEMTKKKNKSLVFDPPLWFDPTSGDHGLNKRKSTLYEDASTQVTYFLENWLFKRRILKTVFNIFICNNLKPLAIWTYPTPWIIIWGNLQKSPYIKMFPHRFKLINPISF